MLFNFLLIFLGGALAESTCNAGSVDRTKVPKSFGADVTESTLRKVWPHIHATHPTVNFWDWYKFFTTYAAYYDHGKAIVGDIYQVWPIDINSYGMTRDIASYNYSLPRALDLSWNEMVFDQLNIPMASLIAANIFYNVEVGFQNHFEGGWNTFSTNYGGTNQTRWEELESSFSFEEYFDHDNVDLLVVVDDSSLISDSDFEEIKSFITNIQTVAGSSSLDISVHAATGGSFKTFQSGALDLSSLVKSDSTDRNFDAIFDAISDDFDSSRSDAAKYVLLIVTGDPTDDVSRIHKKLPGHTQLIIVNIGGQHITLEDDTTKNVYASSAEELNEDDHKVENLLLEVTQGVIHLWNNGATNVRVHANSKRPFCINTESLGEITTSVAAGDSSVEATILASINNYPSYALFDLKRPVLTDSSSLIKIGPSFKTTYLSIINENEQDILIDFSLNMRTPLFGFYSPDIDLSNCNVHEYCSSDGTCDCISTYKRTRDQECTFSQFIKRPDLDQFVCDIKDDVVEFYINLTDFIPPVTDPRYGEDNRGFCFVDNSTINVLMTKLELAGSSNNTFGNKSCDCSAWKNGKPGELQKYTSADCPDIIKKELVEDEAGLLKEVYHFGVGYDDATIETGFGKIMVQPGGRWKLSCDVKRSAAVSMADGEGGTEITYEIENMDEFDVENNQDEVGFDFEFFATADLEGNRRIGERPLLSNQNVYIQTRISDNNLMKVFTSYCEITVTTNGTVEVFEDILNSGCISAEYEDSFLRPEGFIPSDSGADKFLLRPILPTGFQQASVNVACTVVACPSIGPNEPFCEPGPSCGDIYSAQSLRSLKRFSNRPFQENVGMTLEYKQSTVGEDDGRYSDDEESSALSTCLSVTFALLTIALY